MKPDVCYWLNKRAEDMDLRTLCINTAVEATSLNTRSLGRLTGQDEFIRDNVGEDDVLIVSIGGNDVALEPLLCTVCSVAGMVWCTPSICLECALACPPNQHCDPGCLCCGLPGCVGGLCGFPCGFGYMVDMMKNRVENYVKRLVSKQRPKKVLICMIYYPDVDGRGSWADTSLAALWYVHSSALQVPPPQPLHKSLSLRSSRPPVAACSYNRWPGRLQLAIRKMFEHATSQIRIAGTEVVPVPLYEVLDGSNSDDYVQRVEPSPQGGMKMAAAFMDIITSNSSVTSQPQGQETSAAHPGATDVHAV